MPLKQRLILISLVTTGIAMLFAGIMLSAAEVASFRNSLVSDLSVKADIIGNQCTAALLFNVRQDAEEILGALRADEHVEYAAVYSGNGALFATYQGKGSEVLFSQAPPRSDSHHFDFNHLHLFHQISQHGKRVGMVSIRSDLRGLYAVLLRYIIVVGIVIVLSLLVAYVIVTRMQTAITDPLADLVHLMQRISRDKDFSMRASVAGWDELASLADGFNEMLSNIQERDQLLETHRRHLENTVADLQRSTEELQEANKKLKALDRLKSDFISIVSHELRTPLTSIKAFIELILMKPHMPQERKIKLMNTINTESDRLGRLITDLLDLSKIEAGKMNWRMGKVSIDDIVRTSLAGIQPLAQNKGLHMTVNVEPSLPRIFGDKDRLVQVMANILSNAIKFTNNGGAVHITARREPAPQPQIIVEISDTGMGIPAEDIELIFDKFQRSGDLLTSSIEGTGLGLSIAREIVEYHGGALWATSTHGEGSTFTFTLPFEESDEEQAHPLPKSSRNGGSSERHHR